MTRRQTNDRHPISKEQEFRQKSTRFEDHEHLKNASVTPNLTQSEQKKGDFDGFVSVNIIIICNNQRAKEIDFGQNSSEIILLTHKYTI